MSLNQFLQKAKQAAAGRKASATSIGDILRNLEGEIMANIELAPLDPSLCPGCFNTGVEVTPYGSRPCPHCADSRRAAAIAKALELIPVRYASAVLETLEPRDEIHPDQAKHIAYMKAHPLESYYFCGRNDVGKSMMSWALYRYAVTAGRGVMACTLKQLLDTIKQGFQRGGDMNRDWVQLDRFRQSDYPCSVFLEDIDKARATEFAAEVFFDLVDILYNFKHQIVVTSQLDPERRTCPKHGFVNKADDRCACNPATMRLSLIDHFNEADPRYGHGIARRICNEDTKIVRMF